MSKRTEFKWGEEVWVVGCIRRRKEGNRRTWIDYIHEPVKAIFLVGINLADGECEYENYDEEGGNYCFTASKLILGAWIHEKNRAPRKVFLSHIKKVS